MPNKPIAALTTLLAVQELAKSITGTVWSGAMQNINVTGIVTYRAAVNANELIWWGASGARHFLYLGIPKLKLPEGLFKPKDQTCYGLAQLNVIAIGNQPLAQRSEIRLLIPGDS